MLATAAHTTNTPQHSHHHGAQASPDMANLPPPAVRGKRKAETQDNERLSKRLSLLNLGLFPSCLRHDHSSPTLHLEQNGQKLYVPVENPTPSSTLAVPPSIANTPQAQAQGQAQIHTQAQPPASDDDGMQVDDTKHRVYIYSLDDELSSSDSEPDDGRLVFLPDIERHLRKHRLHHLSPASPPIPRPVPVNPEGELAGMQVVLYHEPASISVPAERDSVRKAIIETRARTRERQRREREGGEAVEFPPRVDPSIIAAAARTAPFQASAASFAPPPQDQALEQDDAMDID